MTNVSARAPGVPYELLDPTEDILAQAEADDGVMLVTRRRLAVSVEAGRFHVDVPFDGLRRIELDIERRRPATLVIVPENPSDHPVVLTIAPAQHEAVAHALAVVGKSLHEVSAAGSDRVSLDPVSGDNRI